jgi:hypothetical protein
MLVTDTAIAFIQCYGAFFIMIGYIITGVVCFIVGFIVAARFKDNIVIGFKNEINQTFNDGDN